MSLNDKLKAYDDWSFAFDFSNNSWNGSAQAGDTNCPYIKEYDPADGHGYSSVDACRKSYPTIDDCTDALIEMIKAVKPGATPPLPLVGVVASAITQPPKQWWKFWRD